MEIIVLLLITILLLVIHLIKKQDGSKEEKKEFIKNKKELEREKYLRTSISKLTHELKNPLAVVNGYLEMLNLDDQEKSKKYISIITSEINRSLNIINDFSNYGKLKDIEKEEIDLACLFEDITNILYPIYNSNNSKLEIEIPEELYLYGDYNRLKQVFINLIKNSIEAKKEQEQLIINVAVKETRNNVEINIKDNGIGMSKDMLKHIYDLFYTTKQNGTGIGVSYSNEVIKLHNGKIKYSSKLNEGTEVSLKIPKEKYLLNESFKINQSKQKEKSLETFNYNN